MGSHAEEEESFYVGEHVDALDTINKWCNAEVREVDEDNDAVFVHYTGFVAKYDEWLKTKVSKGERCRIQKQWKRGRKFKINNRIDVLD